MKTVKRIGILILFSIFGTICMSLYHSAGLKGAFVKWQLHGYPPSKVVKLIGLGYVQTETGDIYQYTANPNCSENCWLNSDTLDLHKQFWLPLDDCSHLLLPSLNDYVDSIAICEMWGNGKALTIDAIDKDGKLYQWRHSYMGGPFDLVVPYMGAVIGLFIGLLFLFFSLAFSVLKQQDKIVPEKE